VPTPVNLAGIQEYAEVGPEGLDEGEEWNFHMRRGLGGVLSLPQKKWIFFRLKLSGIFETLVGAICTSNSGRLVSVFSS